MINNLEIKGKFKKYKKSNNNNEIFDYLSSNNITEITVKNGVAFNKGIPLEIDGKPLKINISLSTSNKEENDDIGKKADFF